MAVALSKGALPLFRFKGIQVRLHWSFIALPIYVIFAALSDGLGWQAVWLQLGMVAITFACVVLHEFGHALTARRFGVSTRDITLLPIGGVAALDRIPEEPRQEFWITVAGPAVNLAIALMAFVVMAALGLVSLVSDVLLGGASLWTNLLLFLIAVNLWLFGFNLIPAFPMDGGRILRSALALRMPRERATRIAAGIGRVMAVAFAGYGLYASHPFLVLIGVFVYLAAGAEARNVAQRELLRGARVGQVMRTRFWTLGGAASITEAREGLLAGGETALVVLGADGLPMGIVTSTDIIAAIEAGRSNSRLVDLPPRRTMTVSTTDDAHEATQRMITTGLPLATVVDAGRLVGVLELRNLQEFARLRQAELSGA